MQLKPIDRYRVWHADDPSTITSDEARQFEAYRRASAAGNVAALLAGLELCVDRAPETFPEALQTVPNWLLIKAVDALRQAVADGTAGPKGGGRHSQWSAKWRDDSKDLLRAHEVLAARARGIRGDDAFEEASNRLAGTSAEGSPEYLRKRFQLFQTRRRTEPERYFGTAIHMPEEDT